MLLNAKTFNDFEYSALSYPAMGRNFLECDQLCLFGHKSIGTGSLSLISGVARTLKGTSE